VTSVSEFLVGVATSDSDADPARAADLLPAAQPPGERHGTLTADGAQPEPGAAAPVKHGYPPPRLSVGSITTSYCGEPMAVEGEYSNQPPRDACPVCVAAWRARHGRVPGF